jgi:hypothetical protein
MHDRSRILVSGMILAANVLGALAYLWGAQHAWVIPQEAASGVHSITGEPFVWAAFVLPVWLVFLVINLVWGMVILMRKRWVQGRFWLTSGVIWIIAAIIDFAHH